jgi:hypothetical protein
MGHFTRLGGTQAFASESIGNGATFTGAYAGSGGCCDKCCDKHQRTVGTLHVPFQSRVDGFHTERRKDNAGVDIYPDASVRLTHTVSHSHLSSRTLPSSGVFDFSAYCALNRSCPSCQEILFVSPILQHQSLSQQSYAFKYSVTMRSVKVLKNSRSTRTSNISIYPKRSPATIVRR